MREFLIEMIVWVAVWTIVSWLLSLSGLSQFSQGAYTAVVTVLVDRILFSEDLY